MKERAVAQRNVDGDRRALRQAEFAHDIAERPGLFGAKSGEHEQTFLLGQAADVFLQRQFTSTAANLLGVGETTAADVARATGMLARSRHAFASSRLATRCNASP